MAAWREDRPMTASERIREARDYYALCERANELGVPVSLDDPRTPKTVAGLKAMVREVAACKGP